MDKAEMERTLDSAQSRLGAMITELEYSPEEIAEREAAQDRLELIDGGLYEGADSE